MKKIYLIAFTCFLIFCSKGYAQECNRTNFIASTSIDQFLFHDDGTVTDKKTGLMWQVCTGGRSWIEASTCFGEIQVFSWRDALQFADNSRFGGYSDWRLPNIIEMISIVDTQCVNPAINQNVFDVVSIYGEEYIKMWYWSSSSSSSSSSGSGSSVIHSMVDYAIGGGPPLSLRGSSPKILVRLVRDAEVTR